MKRSCFGPSGHQSPYIGSSPILAIMGVTWHLPSCSGHSWIRWSEAASVPTSNLEACEELIPNQPNLWTINLSMWHESKQFSNHGCSRNNSQWWSSYGWNLNVWLTLLLGGRLSTWTMGSEDASRIRLQRCSWLLIVLLIPCEKYNIGDELLA